MHETKVLQIQLKIHKFDTIIELLLNINLNPALKYMHSNNIENKI